MIYIATDIHGRGYRHVVAYDDIKEFRNVASSWLERRGMHIKSRATVDEVCEALYDAGPGFGARSHRRVSRKEAYVLKRDGAQTYMF
jgi:hypothetical protein